MTPPELVVLGTSSQVPTRHRNHNGYLFRWNGRGLLFDPGEDTSGQMARAGVGFEDIDHIFLTHFHGDHCLGLAGIFYRMAMDAVTGPVRVHFPGYGRPFFERALHACEYAQDPPVEARPYETEGVILDDGTFLVSVQKLSHSIETFGYRVEGPAGLSLAFVMDTRRCRGAYELARDADLLVCEATYLDAEEKEAKERGHMTARHAAELARSAGAKELLLTHFSQRYPSTRGHLLEAKAVFRPVTAAGDLKRYRMPRLQEAVSEGLRR
ncbi:MAG: ribonuclease Z [Myxococcota bacterium]